MPSTSYVKHKSGNQPTNVPSKKRDFTDNFDVTFWCGDLNFRLEQTRDVVVREVLTDSNCSLEKGTNAYKSVLDFDQLNYLKAGAVFKCVFLIEL